MMRKLAAMLSVLLVLVVRDAQASLVNLGDGTIKDTATNLIWLQDWNMPADLPDTGYVGSHHWDHQMTWAQGLDFAGSSAWNLPSRSEFSSLWADVGGNFSGLVAAGFTRIQTGGQVYWTSEEYTDSPLVAWVFDASNGGISTSPMGYNYFAVAVREDVSPIPEPEAYLLALAGLGIVAFFSNRRKA